MKLINIYPLADAILEFDQDMHMFLTHLVEKYPQYAQIAKQSQGYKILDNSLIELGGAASVKRVVEAAEMIGADEIVLPDVFQDGPGTLNDVESALITIDHIYQGKWPFKLMAVAQGKNFTEWLECYQKLMENDKIDVIGIPKVCAKMLPGGRPEVVEKAKCALTMKDHHLLGLWYSASELLEYKHPDMIRSCDTVLASFLAKHQLDPLGVRPDGFTVDLEKDVIDPRKICVYQEAIHTKIAQKKGVLS